MQVFTKYIAKTIVAHLLLITFVCPFFNGKRVDVYNPDNNFLTFLSKEVRAPQKNCFGRRQKWGTPPTQPLYLGRKKSLSYCHI